MTATLTEVISLAKSLTHDEKVELLTLLCKELQSTTVLDPSIKTAESSEDSRTAWDVLIAETGSVEENSDWSVEHNHYLYGLPKQSEDYDAGSILQN